MSVNPDTPRFSHDIDEFLWLLAQHGVEYLIVGGEAVVFYGHARLTGDIDIFYRNSPVNVTRLYKVLDEFWGHDVPGVKDGRELAEAGMVFQFGVPPNRLDLINQIEGVSFDEAWGKRTRRRYRSIHGETDVTYIGLEELIRNKKAVGRARDKEDLEFLEKIANRK